MLSHLRANLWLLVLTLVLCSAVYPLVLWAIGQTAFHDQAEGSLLAGPDGKPVGSRLIGQPFSKDEYFQPRPSATTPSYNAAASGASNWGASNMLLRARVAQALGPIVKYGTKSPKKDQLVGPDVEKWFQEWSMLHPNEKSGVVAKWADTYPSVAQAWVKADKANGAYVAEWQKLHAQGDPGNLVKPKPEDMAVEFFKSYSQEHPGTWPVYAAPDGQKEKKWQHVTAGTDIQSYFFDMWRQEHADADLQEVPADMVMASGSGLDPHITLKNAFYQLDRVAGAWAKLKKADEATVRRQIEDLLNEKAEASLGGLVGVKLVNVLEVNLELEKRYGSLATR